ncbi:MAG: hypothetical protein AAFU67_01525 [Bacteroidota bacterium]
MFDKNKLGLFRANPHANINNAKRLVDEGNPGTPMVDTGTITTASAVSIEGVRYTGQDGTTVFEQLFSWDNLTQQKTPITLSIQSTPDQVQQAIYRVIEQYEVDALVSVTDASGNFAVEHIGSGTLSAIVVDGADVALSRANITNVVGAVGVKTNKVKHVQPKVLTPQEIAEQKAAKIKAAKKEKAEKK